MEEDDEAFVERLVSGTSSPPTHRANPSTQYASAYHGHALPTRVPMPHSHSSVYSPHGYESMSTSPTHSSFANTDPFFAAVQASAANQAHQGPFLPHAWPSQQSPFFQPQNHGINAFPTQIDTRSHSRPRYVAAGCIDG